MANPDAHSSTSVDNDRRYETEGRLNVATLTSASTQKAIGG